jgi:exosortase
MRTALPLRLASIFALVVVVTLVYWPSAAVYRHEWLDFRNITFTHGFLILAVCLALVIRARGELAAAPVRVSPPALAALALCIVAWLVCYRASVQDLHITIFPAIVWLAVVAAFGWRLGLLLAFPVAFFYFAVPSLAQLGLPLQALTVQAMRAFFWLTGPTVQIAGDLIRIPNGSFIIEEGCSGLHFMIVGLAVAALHGELRGDPWRVRVAQLALMGVLALLANWVRVYTVIESGYLTDMRSYLVSVSHYWFGWGVFAVALLAFFSLSARLGPPEAPQPRTPTSDAAATPFGGVAVTILVLAGLPAASLALRALQPLPPLATAASLHVAPPWTPAASNTRSAWQPTFPGADEQQRQSFANAAGETVEVFRVAYHAQRQGAKLIGTGTSLAGAQLKVRSEGLIDGAAGTFREALVTDRSGERSLIWSRYRMAGRDFVIPLVSQLWYGINATVSNPPAALLAYRAACGPEADCRQARRVLREFTAGAGSG